MNELEQLYKIAPVYSELFDKQLAFALSPSRFITALCSSRAGKTKVCAAIAIQELVARPNSLGLYLALTDKSVADIFFPPLKEFLAKYCPEAKVTADEVTFPNGSKLLIAGANNMAKIESFRGIKLLFCIIDEAASFRQHILRYLIDEIIIQRLSDLQGKLMLIGTPAAHCMGLFYDITELNSEEGWDNHRWTAFDNPYMAEQWEKDSKLFLQRKKATEANPKYRREFKGQWCTDEELLMIKPFTVDQPPTPFSTETWRTVIAIDFGFNDQTAFSIIGWRKDMPKAYVLETFGESQLSVSGIAQHLIRLKQKYKPMKIVGDPAGASKIIIAEYSEKYHIFIEPAQKSNKADYIEIFNDALINDELILCPNTTNELQKEMKSIVWNEEHTRELEGMKCDHLDATLYAFRETLEYLEKIVVIKPLDDTERERQFMTHVIKHDKQVRDSRKDDPFFDDIANFLNT
jgi:hypothetical protein